MVVTQAEQNQESSGPAHASAVRLRLRFQRPERKCPAPALYPWCLVTPLSRFYFGTSTRKYTP